MPGDGSSSPYSLISIARNIKNVDPSISSHNQWPPKLDDAVGTRAGGGPASPPSPSDGTKLPRLSRDWRPADSRPGTGVTFDACANNGVQRHASAPSPSTPQRSHHNRQVMNSARLHSLANHEVAEAKVVSTVGLSARRRIVSREHTPGQARRSDVGGDGLRFRRLPSAEAERLVSPNSAPATPRGGPPVHLRAPAVSNTSSSEKMAKAAVVVKAAALSALDEDLFQPEDDLDEDLVDLLREGGQMGLSPAAAKGLGSLDYATLRALYSRAKERLESLPAVIVRSVNEEVMLVKAPGRKGVDGYVVGQNGAVMASNRSSHPWRRLSFKRNLVLNTTMGYDPDEVEDERDEDARNREFMRHIRSAERRRGPPRPDSRRPSDSAEEVQSPSRRRFAYERTAFARSNSGTASHLSPVGGVGALSPEFKTKASGRSSGDGGGSASDEEPEPPPPVESFGRRRRSTTNSNFGSPSAKLAAPIVLPTDLRQAVQEALQHTQLRRFQRPQLDGRRKELAETVEALTRLPVPDVEVSRVEGAGKTFEPSDGEEDDLLDVARPVLEHHSTPYNWTLEEDAESEGGSSSDEEEKALRHLAEVKARAQAAREAELEARMLASDDLEAAWQGLMDARKVRQQVKGRAGPLRHATQSSAYGVSDESEPAAADMAEWDALVGQIATEDHAKVIVKDTLATSAAVLAERDADMRAFAPERNERIRVAANQVCRRLQQCAVTRSSLLDLSLAPHLSRGDFGPIFQALRAASGITSLRAVDNILTPSGVRGLCALLNQCPYLTALDVHNNKVLGPDVALELSVLIHAGPTSSCLRSLNISACPLGEAGLTSLAHGLADNTVLEELDLSATQLNDAALQVLENVLERNDSLRVLRLARNPAVTQRGVKAIVSSLSANSSLQLLDLTSCELSDGGVGPLADLIRQNTALCELRLGGNAIGWRGWATLAEALATASEGSSALTHLVMDDNPLGYCGLQQLMVTLQTCPKLQSVSFLNCAVAHGAGQPPLTVNPTRPNGTYVADLADPAGRQLATELLAVCQSSGSSSWARAKLDGANLRHTAVADWPAQMPPTGCLQVTVLNARRVDPSSPVFTHSLHNSLLSALSAKSMSSEWKCAVVACATTVAACTAQQAGQMLTYFQASARISSAAALLVSCMVDVQHLAGQLRTCCSDDEALAVLNGLGLPALMPFRQQLLPGWRNCCSGRYSLDLGLQMPYLLAVLLIQISASQRAGVKAAAQNETQAHQVALESKAAVRLGDADECVRNATIDGKLLEGQTGYLKGAQLPPDGVLQLDFINLRQPQRAAPLVSRALWMEADASFKALWLGAAKRLGMLAAERDKERAALPASSALMATALVANVEVDTAEPLLSGWQKALMGTKLSQSAAATDYEWFSVRLHEHVVNRIAAYTAQPPPPWTPPPVVEAAPVAPPVPAPKGGKKLDPKAEAAAAAAAAAAEKAAKKGADKKGADKKEKKGGKGGRGRKGSGGRGELSGADLVNMKYAELEAAGRSQLLPMLQHATLHPLTCNQVLFLLRLLPDLPTRINALVLLFPALVDPANLVDVVLDLTCPVLMPPHLRAAVASLNPAAQKAAAAAAAAAATAAAVSAPATPPAPPGASPVAAAAAMAAGSSKPATAPASPAPAGAGAAAAAVPAAVDGVPSNQALMMAPRGLVAGPELRMSLLKRVASRVGWCHLGLLWARPGALLAMPFTLHLQVLEHLQLLLRICKWDARQSARLVDLLGEQSELNTMSAAAGALAGQPSSFAPANSVLQDVWLDGQPLSLITGPGAPGVLEQILSRTCVGPDTGSAGELRFQLLVTPDARQTSAAVLLQAAWRGYRERLRVFTFLRGGGRKWWPVAWRLYRNQHITRRMRQLASDLELRRAEDLLMAPVGREGDSSAADDGGDSYLSQASASEMARGDIMMARGDMLMMLSEGVGLSEDMSLEASQVWREAPSEAALSAAR